MSKPLSPEQWHYFSPPDGWCHFTRRSRVMHRRPCASPSNLLLMNSRRCSWMEPSACLSSWCQLWLLQSHSLSALTSVFLPCTSTRACLIHSWATLGGWKQRKSVWLSARSAGKANSLPRGKHQSLPKGRTGTPEQGQGEKRSDLHCISLEA